MKSAGRNRVLHALLCGGICLSAVLAGCRSHRAATCDATLLLFTEFPSRFADGNCLQGLSRPVVLPDADRPSFCQSDQPLLFDMHHSPMPTRLLLDESQGTGGGYDTLYLDYNDNGDFLDDPAYRATAFEGTMFPDGQPVVLYFRNVHMPRDRKQSRSCLVQIFIERLDGWPNDITSLHPRIIPQRWAVGTVLLNGKAIPAAVIDRNWDDTFITKDSGGMSHGDILVLGLDGETTLQPCDLDEHHSSARFVMKEYLTIDGAVYRVEASKESGGVRIQLLPAGNQP